MKALLDAQLSHDIASLLRQRGLDVEAVTERTDIPNTTPDAQLMAIAAGEQRALVTNNLEDFRPIAARRIARGHGHAGLILIASSRSRTRAATGRLADAIEAVMRANPDGLALSERWLE